MHCTATDPDPDARLSPSVKIPESVLVVIHSVELDVLLLERADLPGFWQSVTGAKAAPSENLRTTACREVAEETGIVVGSGRVADSDLVDWQLRNVYEIFPRWRHRYATGVTHNTEHVYGLRVPPDITLLLAPAEHLRYRWLPWREAAAVCSSASNAAAIRELPARRGWEPN